MRSKIWKILIAIYIFLLPWQTRWIYAPHNLNGSFWEYGSASWYFAELILWAAIAIFAFDKGRCINYRHLFGKVHFKTHKYNLLFIVGIFIWFGLSVLLSKNLAISYDLIFRVLEGMCLLVMLAGSGEKKLFFYSFWSSSVVVSIFGISQFFSQEIAANKWLGLAAHSPSELGSFVVEAGTGRWLRAYGSFGSPNILGGFLASAFIFGLIYYLSSRPVEKIWLSLGQALILIGLVLTFSRGAMLATVIGWIAVGIFVLARSKQTDQNFFKRYHFLGLYIKQFIFYAIIIAFLFSMLGPLFSARADLNSRLEVKSLSERSTQIETAVNIIKNNFWIGVGPGAYTAELYAREPFEPGYSYQPVHNIYLLLLAEWGVIGFVFWMIIFGFICRQIFRRSPELLPVILVVLTTGIFDHYWWSLYSGLSLWWLLFSLVLV